VEKDSARVSLIKELKVTEIRKPTTYFFFPLFRYFSEKGVGEGVGFYLSSLGILLAGDILSTILLFPFELAFHRGEPSYKSALRLSGQIEGELHSFPYIVDAPKIGIKGLSLKGNILKETIETAFRYKEFNWGRDKEWSDNDEYREWLNNEWFAIGITIKFTDLYRYDDDFEKGGSAVVSNPVSISYFITEYGTLKQEENFYEFSKKSKDEELSSNDIFRFDELKLISREMASSNKIVLSMQEFASDHNKKEYPRMEEAKKRIEAEEEAEQERRSHYHSGGAAFSAMNSVLVGDFIEDVVVEVMQVLDDGFLAVSGQFVFYVVSAHLPIHNKLTDNRWVIIDGKILGTHKYTAIQGNRKTIPKVKASKISIRY
jgi:hypothetical protein